MLEILRQLVAGLAATGIVEAISGSFDNSSKEISQSLAVLNETLLQVRDGIKTAPGAG